VGQGWSVRVIALGVMTAMVALAGSAVTRDAVGGPIEIVPVESWTRHPLDYHGVPEGWRTYETPGGQPAYDFTIVEDEGRRALLLRSHGDHSTVARRVKINLAATPILEWNWKITQLPAGADLRRRQTTDAAPHLFLVWPRRPEMFRSRLIGYVWDPTFPVGAIQKSQKSGTVTFLVVRSSTAQLGQWLTERRNVLDDFRTIYGEEPEAPAAVALSIDTNDTKSPSEGLIGSIQFRSRD
jgi:Protein of unknown function (DUF3047)